MVATALSAPLHPAVLADAQSFGATIGHGSANDVDQRNAEHGEEQNCRTDGNITETRVRLSHVQLVDVYVNVLGLGVNRLGGG